MFISGWLDDIGLPQYKSHFDEARVDGRVLHYMTVVSCQNLLNLVTLRWSLCDKKLFLPNDSFIFRLNFPSE